MKTIVKLTYFAAIVSMFILFFWLLIIRNEQYQQGYYHPTPTNFTECQEQGGEIYSNRCYISETVFFTKSE